MNTYFEYLIYCIPVIFIILSLRYNLKFKKLKNSGRIPRIVSARQREIVFLVLAVLSVLIILIGQDTLRN